MSELIVVDAAAWREWLDEHHGDQPEGVWLVLARKGFSTPTSLTYADALDEALCYGWIDGQKRSRDEQTSVQRFTPRRARSTWSQRNVGKVAQLETDGRMHAAGRAEVERAKADGRWERAYAAPSKQEVPDDLAAALAAEPKAQAMFEILTSANRFAVVYRVNGAKKPETRARRIAQFVDQLSRGETVYPQKRTL
ncbi:YdeI/OmpD-associated family protein [Kribbella solani]|uniref:Uncharacterized protein YdeI (YjbR/CyaY-like superfamily) n=1 Tax=Kribbella solani TaxID=236067 RepID=A0A841DSH9_9ACTN|nr:YdeI/OmpD-associated family protein [Kribbella solani]MBB5982074.1 uncharacterized protein YdeI (YjbR/CyaY-like superfamily) [Kribbella solani]